MRLYTIFISLVAVISVILNIKLLYDRYSPKIVTFNVIEVIDGDTFKIVDRSEVRRVRLMGVDAPQMGKCLSSEAKDKLTELVLGKDVALEDQFSDPYGRIMANVFAGDTYVNRVMLASGMGRMDYYENPRRDELKEAYKEARLNKWGIFSNMCLSVIPPVSPDTGIPCAVKGNVDDNTQVKSYYLPGCNNYSQVAIDLSTDDQWFCFEGEAIASGFTKSKTCSPNE